MKPIKNNLHESLWMNKSVKLLGLLATTGIVALLHAPTDAVAEAKWKKNRPCDIYANNGTPCVAAHSTTRALLKKYKGKLFQVVRSTEMPGKVDLKKDSEFAEKKEIKVDPKTGYANLKPLDNFCGPSDCRITIIYDQTGNGIPVTRYNKKQKENLRGPVRVAGGANKRSIIFKDKAITVNGNPAYGLFKQEGGGYRNVNPKNIPVNEESMGIYAVFDAKHYSSPCCFNYGTAQLSGHAEGAGSMSAIYFGGRPNNKENGVNPISLGYQKNSKDTPSRSYGHAWQVHWGWGKGPDTGAWLLGDFEAGMYSGTQPGFNEQNQSIPPEDEFVTAFMGEQNSAVGTSAESTNRGFWSMRSGNAVSNDLTEQHAGPFVRPILRVSRPEIQAALKKAWDNGYFTDDEKNAKVRFVDFVKPLKGTEKEAVKIRYFYFDDEALEKRFVKEILPTRFALDHPDRDKNYLVYHPSKKEGAIIIGTGGDNGRISEGTFYEGAILNGIPSAKAEKRVQREIVRAKYRK